MTNREHSSVTESARRRGPDADHERSGRSDRGVTLVELLVVVVLSGTLVFALTTSFLVVARSAPQAETRLAESKDVTFLTAWLPVDLSTAVASWDELDDAVIKAEMSVETAITYHADLPGTNVLTLVLPTSSGGALEVISYRYEQRSGDDWRIVRYKIENPGTASETIEQVGVADEVPAPPAGWVPEDGVGHAIEVASRNQDGVSPVGEDVTVRFESGNDFTTGGAGLSAEDDLTPLDPVTLPDPTAPPTRCGGRIALLIDTSGSVPASHGGIATEEAAVGFIEAFIGTPTSVSINGFDRHGYAMVAGAAQTEARAEFHSVLDGDDPNVGMMVDRIRALDDLDGAWPGGGAALELRDPNLDGIMWDQIGSGTNWEDGLYNIFFDASTDQPHNAYQPDLVVLITDGQPNRVGGPSRTVTGSAVDAAAAVADEGRSQGSRVIGVIVGNGASNTSNLEQVVGSNAWTGSVSGGTVDVGNAVAADYFSGSFSELGLVLRSIMIAECGGTVTVRKQLDDGSNPGGQWNYSSPTGSQVLDLASQSSVTFDFNFETGTIEQTVRITEEARSGYSFVRADCSAGGEALAAEDVVQRPDGVAGVDVTVRPDQAVSCVMVSESE